MNTVQYSELDKIKIKIKALAAKTVANGCSEEEALAAMNKVGHLLTQYNLTMNELDVRDASYRTIHMQIDRQKRHPIDHAVPALAALTGTKTWFHKRWGTGADSTYAFFGQESDLLMAEYLFKTILAAMESELKAFKRTDAYRIFKRDHMPDFIRSHTAGEKASAAISFQRGMASRLAQRLMQLKAEQDAELRKRAGGSAGALMVLKGQLVEENYRGPKLVDARTGYRVGNHGAFIAGRDAGNKVNLSRPLKDGAGARGLLK